MKRFERYILVLILVSLLLFAPTKKVYACTCSAEEQNTRFYIESSLEYADIVFSGRVVKVEEIGYSELREQPMVKATFEVYKTWKGQLYRNFIVRTDECDYPFLQGEEYLIFAYGNITNLYAGTYCGPTSELENSNEYLQILGDGKSPDSENPYVNPTDLMPLSNQEENKSLQYIIIGVCSMEILLAIVTILWLTNKLHKAK